MKQFAYELHQYNETIYAYYSSDRMQLPKAPQCIILRMTWYFQNFLCEMNNHLHDIIQQYQHNYKLSISCCIDLLNTYNLCYHLQFYLLLYTGKYPWIKLLDFEWKIAIFGNLLLQHFCRLLLLINKAMIRRKSFVVE